MDDPGGRDPDLSDCGRITANPDVTLPAKKPVVGGKRQYLREGRMSGFVCASLLGLAATLAEGALVVLATSLPGHVESW